MADKDPQKDALAAGKYQPPGKRTGDGSSEEGPVVVRSAARIPNVPMQYPQLTESNYHLWATKMKIIMRPLGVCSEVEADAEYDEERDMGAMAAISQSVPDDVMMALVEYKTAKEAWAAIRTMRIGEARVTEVRINQLMWKFDRMLMDDGETISAFSRRLNALVSEIHALGEDLQEKTVVKRLFAAVPDRFSQIIGTIEQWGDMKTMSVAEAVGRLRAFEENEIGRRGDHGDKNEQLMLVTRALENLLGKQKLSGEGSSKCGAGGRGGRGRGQSGRGGGRSGRGERGEHSENKPKKHRKFDKSKVRCFNCDELGHFKSECPEPKKEKLNLAKKMMLGQVC